MFDLSSQYGIKADLDVEGFLIQSSANTLSNQSVQLTQSVQHDKEDLSVFFGIGMLVNIVMITSFFIWAIKQWKKNDTKKK